MNLSEENLASIDTEKTDAFFAHYGVPGMKWGQKGSGMQATFTQKPVLGAKLGGAKTRKETAAIDKRADFAARRRTLSDKDLKAMVERLGNEKKLKELVEADIAPGKAAAKSTLKWAGKVALPIAGVAIAGGIRYGLRTKASGGTLNLVDAAPELFPFPKKK